MIDESLLNYWGAARGLRWNTDPRRRAEWLRGPFALAITLEKDPRLRALLISIQNQEIKRPA